MSATSRDNGIINEIHVGQRKSTGEVSLRSPTVCIPCHKIDEVTTGKLQDWMMARSSHPVHELGDSDEPGLDSSSSLRQSAG
jgi:hypothetical protein